MYVWKITILPGGSEEVSSLPCVKEEFLEWERSYTGLPGWCSWPFFCFPLRIQPYRRYLRTRTPRRFAAKRRRTGQTRSPLFLSADLQTLDCG